MSLKNFQSLLTSTLTETNHLKTFFIVTQMFSQPTPKHLKIFLKRITSAARPKPAEIFRSE